MIEYQRIVNNLCLEANIKNEAELSKKLDMSRQSLQNHKTRDSIPYKQIISFCIINKIDINKIFSNENISKTPNINNQSGNGLNIQGNHNNVSNIQNNSKNLDILEKIEKLPTKRQDYYYHVISAEILNLED